MIKKQELVHPDKAQMETLLSTFLSSHSDIIVRNIRRDVQYAKFVGQEKVYKVTVWYEERKV